MRKLTLIGAIVIGTALLLVSPSAFAQSPKKVLLVPFTLYADKDMTYLQKGIGQMLTSRLTRQDKVEVIQADPAMAKDKNPAERAKALGVDFMVTGSLTLLGNSVSTDAKVTDLKLGKQVMTFSQVGKDQAAIIDHVDQLAVRINDQLFGRKTEAAVPAPSTVPAPAAKSPDPGIYQHPEKLYTQTEGGGSERVGGQGNIAEASLMMRGRRVQFQMRGLTTGDVDGDGQNDFICIGPSNLVVYGVVKKQLVKKAVFNSKGANYVGVDAVDVNGNGKAEIFITNFSNIDSRVASFVLEWDGKGLVRLADKLNWHFRSVEVPSRGKVLAGQRQGVDDPFAATIHEIGWQGGSYGPVERLPLPRGLNIYGFAYGNIRSTQDTEVAAYNKGGFVRILTHRGKEQWTTSERYGGSHLYIEFPDPGDRSDKKYVYLAPRIRLLDLDGDGLQEIFVIKNKDITGAFDRVRLFKNGRLEALKWDDLGMTSLWKTRNLAKYISDFTLADVDGDGKTEAVVTVVQKSSVIMSKSRSYLAVFNLPSAGDLAKTQSQ